ncbi:MAG: dihydroneopterin aldolase [Kiritimatiellae bacterium]|nr:dihydroneopterin aldolase [Kiritimatiellia bacterium]MBP5226997.1 dihydroneopterin aldolase [Kiritimatiellia bacterium]
MDQFGCDRLAGASCPDQLQLNGIEVFCVIGDRPDERNRNQYLSVDVTLLMDLSAVERSDRLEDTVDYAALTVAIQTRLREARCRMIEHAAGLVASVALGFDARIQAVRVRVEKRKAIPGLQNASVVIVRKREA